MIFDFVKKYNLEIIKVVDDSNVGELEEAYTGSGKFNSDFLNSLDVSSAKEKIISEIEKEKSGEKTSISIKRGGFLDNDIGGPIPMIYLEDGSIVPVRKMNYP